MHVWIIDTYRLLSEHMIKVLKKKPFDDTHLLWQERNILLSFNSIK